MPVFGQIGRPGAIRPVCLDEGRCQAAWGSVVEMIAKFSRSAAGILLVALALAGCREEEQNRPLQYKPGVYQGAEDEKLSEEELNELRFRGSMQQFI